eukprot:TRINITY_DN32188_c0_g1_i1.p1 TRINITY_DN32188_c0_g1~~TRINITY_DN32188_c0_g1_i1.p1  ORF type:complete len:435 (+),score=94.72 TRINITY_DN32188_c0_g1_i1:93-1307(+)
MSAHLRRLAARAARAAACAGAGAAAGWSATSFARQAAAQQEDAAEAGGEQSRPQRPVPRAARVVRDAVYQIAVHLDVPHTPPGQWLHRRAGAEVPEAACDLPGIGRVRVYRDCHLVVGKRRKRSASDGQDAAGDPPEPCVVHLVLEPAEGADSGRMHWVQFVRPDGADLEVGTNVDLQRALLPGQAWRRNSTVACSSPVLWRRAEWYVDAPVLTVQRAGVYIDAHCCGNRGPEEVSVVVYPDDLFRCALGREGRRVRVDFDTYLVSDGVPVYRLCWGAERQSQRRGGGCRTLGFAAAPCDKFDPPEGWGPEHPDRMPPLWPVGWRSYNKNGEPQVRMLADASELLRLRSAPDRPGQHGHFEPDGKWVPWPALPAEEREAHLRYMSPFGPARKGSDAGEGSPGRS